QGVTVTGITLQNAPMVNQQYWSDTGLLISGETVYNPYASASNNISPNTDGMDVASTNVLIENCNISTGDDVIAIGSSSHVALDISVTGCTFGTGHGLSIGSHTSGTVTNLWVSNCTFTGTQYGLRFKSDRGSGGMATNLNYSNLTMTGIVYYPIYLDSYYGAGTAPTCCPATDPGGPVSLGTGTPQWQNITFTNISATTASGAKEPLQLWGLPEAPATNVLFDDVRLYSAGSKEAQVINATGVSFTCTCRINGAAVSASDLGTYNASIDYLACAAATATESPTCTASPTATLSASPTRTTSPTAASSASPTRTASLTATLSPNPTRTASPTATASASPISTPSSTTTPSVCPTSTTSPTATLSVSPTTTPSPTAMLSASPTATSSPTVTQRLSMTSTSSPTDTPSIEQTFTMTLSMTPSAGATMTVSGTNSPSASATVSSSATPTWTMTAAASATTVVTGTLSPTPSLTFTKMGTPSASPSATATPAVPSLFTLTVGAAVTGSPSDVTVTGDNFTPGDQVIVTAGGIAQEPISSTVINSTELVFVLPAQPAGTPSVSILVESPAGLQSNALDLGLKAPLTATQTAGGSLQILGLYPVPNPNPTRLAVDLAGAAESLDVKLYNKAFILVLKFSVPGLLSGWNPVPIPPTFGSLASGLYYIRVQALRQASVSKVASTKVFILR
ncbi:MAG: glycosyl hydrolase family 28 protein, partial [bacterium]